MPSSNHSASSSTMAALSTPPRSFSPTAAAAGFRTPKTASRPHGRAPPRPALPPSPAQTSSPGDVTATETQTEINPAVPQQIGVPGLIRTLKDIRQGVWKHPSPGWAKYSVSVEEYHKLLDKIEEEDDFANWFLHTVRCDYSNCYEELVLRVGGPLHVHETMCKSLERRIEAELERLKAVSLELASVIADIRPRGSAAVPLNINGADADIDTNTPSSPALSTIVKLSRKGNRYPDAQYSNKHAIWSSPIIEVSHSQKLKDLSGLAKDFIAGSEFNIEAMVEMKLEYTPPGRVTAPARGMKKSQPSKKAVVTVWRPGVVTRKDSTGTEKKFQAPVKVMDEAFRSETGKHLPGTLRLPLECFVPLDAIDLDTIPQEWRPLIEATTIDISFADLCKDLEDGEEEHMRKVNMIGGRKRPMFEAVRPYEEEMRAKRKKMVAGSIEREDPAFRTP